MLNYPTKLCQRNEKIVLGALLVFGLLVSNWAAIADEPVRVAKRIEEVDAKSTQKLFDREKSRPWERLADSDGYIRVLPQVLGQRTALMESIKKQIPEAIQLSEMDEHLKIWEDLVLVESGWQLKFSELLDRDENSIPKYSVSTFSDRYFLQFRKPIHWKVVMGFLPWKDFLENQVGGLFAPLKQWVSENEESSQLSFISSTANFEPHDVEAAKFVWKKIDGGIVGLVAL